MEDDARVADPLSDDFLNLFNTTARVNREVFTELFRPIPSNLVHNWNAYDVSAHRRLFKFLRLVAPCHDDVDIQAKSQGGPCRPWYAAPPREGAPGACAWIDRRSTDCALLPFIISVWGGFNIENHRTF